MLLLACLPAQAADLYARLKKGAAKHNRALLLAAMEADKREIARLDKDTQFARQWKLRFAKKYGTIMFGTPSVYGTVHIIHGDSIEIGAGRREDVYVGALFDLSRGSGWRGTCRVTDVQVARCTAVLVKQARNGPPKPGDLATMRYGDRPEPKWKDYLAAGDLPLVKRFHESRLSLRCARTRRTDTFAEMRWYRRQAAAKGEPFPEPKWPTAKVLGSPAPRLVALGFGKRAGLRDGENVVIGKHRLAVISVTDTSAVAELRPGAAPPRAGALATYRKW